MSTHDDDIEFDFFDEPETVEATQRGRRLPRRDGGDGEGRRPARPPLQTPTGLIPLARLVGLIAIAIAIIVGLVFWVGACQGTSKHAAYADYATKVKAIAQSSNQLGLEFATKLSSPGLKAADLETSLQKYAQQEQQAYDQAQQIRAPGPLRAIHQHLVDALALRAKGLAALGDAVSQTASTKDVDGRRRDPQRQGAAPHRERRRLGPALPDPGEPGADGAGDHRRRHPRLELHHESRARERALVRRPPAAAPRRRVDRRDAGREARRCARLREGAAPGQHPLVVHRDDREGLRRPLVRRHRRGLRRLPGDQRAGDADDQRGRQADRETKDDPR